jgi:hypothetical protein
MVDTITISKTFAAWLLKTATSLIAEGLGSDYNPLEPDTFISDELGLIDEIPMEDSVLWNWAHGLIMLCKSLAGVLAREMIVSEGGDDPFRHLEE